MTQNDVPGDGPNVFMEIKDEILEVLNQLREVSERLQKGVEVSCDKVNSLLARGEALAQRIPFPTGNGAGGRRFFGPYKQDRPGHKRPSEF